MRREELQILADELLREVDAAMIDTANASIAGALEHLCTLEDALPEDLRLENGCAGSAGPPGLPLVGQPGGSRHSYRDAWREQAQARVLPRHYMPSRRR